MSVGKLLLHPRSISTAPPSRAALVAAMQHLGLFGRPLTAESSSPRFLAGERFLQLITFLGCSPHIDLDPPQDGKSEFCYLELLGPWRYPRFLQGPNTRPPGCPACRRKHAEWRSLVGPKFMQEGVPEWTCPACGHRAAASDWNWRQQAGIGRVFVQINSIFPSEAVPTNELMSRLEQLSGGTWQYFYLRDWL